MNFPRPLFSRKRCRAEKESKPAHSLNTIYIYVSTSDVLLSLIVSGSVVRSCWSSSQPSLIFYLCNFYDISLLFRVYILKRGQSTSRTKFRFVHTVLFIYDIYYCLFCFIYSVEMANIHILFSM